MRIVAGIVLYNPNLETLSKSISELEQVVNSICLVDNFSNNIQDIIKLIQSHQKVTMIENEKNYGIAKALNQLLDFANLNKNQFLLTLDQDSILKKEMLNNMLQYTNEKDAALICPIINDLNKKKHVVQTESIIDVNRCISSGTLMNLKICNEIGTFDEKMFIDYVDFDYCKRVMLHNKRIIRVKNAVINHEIGKRSKHKFLFWTVYPTNHSPIRIYYYVRNIYYYLRKFNDQMTIKEKLIEYRYLFWKLFCIIFYEDGKCEKLKMFFKGLKDSKKMK